MAGALYKEWEIFKQNLLRETPIPVETEAERHERIIMLQQNPEAFFAYYFPHYCYAAPAAFHKKATKRILQNSNWYEVRAWSRELAKSARTMLELIYLTLTGQIKNVLLISHSSDQAINLLAPYRLSFEYNQRIIADYGTQKGRLIWEAQHFITACGVSFIAFGAGQNPRGSRNEEIRPDVIVFDDIDTDEEVRSPQRIDKKWRWIEQAVIPTVSVSKNKRIIFLGNIIGKDTCITRAMDYADHAEVINIRDKNGKSVWPEKNTEANIDHLLSKISFASAQKEYFNNPVTEGNVFREIRWDNVPPLSKFKFLIAYGDPAPSNKDSKSNCYKANFLIGNYDGKFYIITGYLDHVVNAEFVDWYYRQADYVNGKTIIYNYIENNTLQDPFLEQVFKPLLNEIATRRQRPLSLIADNRKKPDKFARIEGNLEPLNREGKLIFNIAEKNNPHMKRLEEQFLCVDPQLSAPVDGPDCIEGGIFKLYEKIRAIQPIGVTKRNNKKNKYRI